MHIKISVYIYINCIHVHSCFYEECANPFPNCSLCQEGHELMVSEHASVTSTMPVFYHFKDGTVSLNPSTTGTIIKVPQKRRGNIKDILQFVYCKKEPTIRGVLCCRGHHEFHESGLFVRKLTVEMRNEQLSSYAPISKDILNGSISHHHVVR